MHLFVEGAFFNLFEVIPRTIECDPKEMVRLRKYSMHNV